MSFEPFGGEGNVCLTCARGDDCSVHPPDLVCPDCPATCVAQNGVKRCLSCGYSEVPIPRIPRPGDRISATRPWRDYPLGTRALAYFGGGWTRTSEGWKADGGDTFPTPGAEAYWVVLPATPTRPAEGADRPEGANDHA